MTGKSVVLGYTYKLVVIKYKEFKSIEKFEHLNDHMQLWMPPFYIFETIWSFFNEQKRDFFNYLRNTILSYMVKSITGTPIALFIF